MKPRVNKEHVRIMIPAELLQTYQCNKEVLDRQYLHFYFWPGETKKHGTPMDNRKRIAYVMRSESMKVYGRIE